MVSIINDDDDHNTSKDTNESDLIDDNNKKGKKLKEFEKKLIPKSEETKLNSNKDSFNLTRIFFKSITNTSNEIYLNLNSDIKKEIPKIMGSIGISEEKNDIKLIFSGKILSTDKTFDSYGKLILFLSNYKF
jgi:hypothetical protein